VVNLIYGKKLVEEVIQKDLTGRTRKELNRILNDDRYREEIQEGYRLIVNELGEPGISLRIGARMFDLLKAEIE
jgi:lipid A disaccharide synthetase